MNPEVKEKWVAALLSGDYEQGRGYLHKDGQFCCLGVLCDLAVKEGVIPEPKMCQNEPDYGAWEYGDDWSRSDVTLPAAVAGWLGVPDTTLRDDSGRGLDYYNDHGESFETIADRIERMS